MSLDQCQIKTLQSILRQHSKTWLLHKKVHWPHTDPPYLLGKGPICNWVNWAIIKVQPSPSISRNLPLPSKECLTASISSYFYHFLTFQRLVFAKIVGARDSDPWLKLGTSVYLEPSMLLQANSLTLWLKRRFYSMQESTY